jgi:hypothetical protein
MADAPFCSKSPDRAAGVVVAFPARAKDTEHEIADFWRAWVAENDALRTLLPVYNTTEDLAFITTFEALGDRVEAKIQRLLATRSTSPVALAAKLHLALQFSDSNELSTYAVAPLAAALRDLLPQLPDDMAARLEPLTATEGSLNAALDA